MSSITSELARLFDTIKNPGDFYVSDSVEMFAPRLEVDGVGPIALPLLPAQAERLVAVAERAPYGRGEETLVDTEVRRTWQIGAERVHIGGKRWEATLAHIVERAAAGLGVAEPVEAQLYKLLVYDQGSFFVSHRDTEKAPGMFATLVVVLPSLYSGGELVVRHRGREAVLDLCRSEPSEAAYAAFYADCVHEVRPVTSGCRLTLIYNLVRSGPGWLPQPPDYSSELAHVVALLRQWAERLASGESDTPEKLVYLLQHAYSRAELDFDALKGADAAVAAVAVPAAREAQCDVHLALVFYEESGGAEYSGYGGWDDGAFEVGEVFDTFQTIRDWRTPDGSPSPLPDLPFLQEELCPEDAFVDLEPEDTQFSEATGNEGASFERTYCLAGLVFWPQGRRLAVLNQAGLPQTLPYLENLVQRSEQEGTDPAAPLWREANELAGHMLRTWSNRRPRYAVEPGIAAKTLALLRRLGDTQHIERFLAEISSGKDYGAGDNAELLLAAGLLPPQRAAALFLGVVAGNAVALPEACGDLLARCLPMVLPADLRPAAAALLEALPGDPARAGQLSPWQRPRLAFGLVADVLYALGHIDGELAERALDYFLAWPETYAMDAMLLPAVRRLAGQAPDLPVVRRLAVVCLAHLRARIAEPLAPPEDWARAGELACRCSRCSELSRFLADPQQETWRFKAAEADRSHVLDSIRRSACDVDTRTDQQGRPYTLVCKKNQASYQRRVRQRRQDLDDLACLEAVA